MVQLAHSLLFITISCLQMELNISGILFLMEGMIHLAFSHIFITIFVGFFKVKNDFLPQWEESFAINLCGSVPSRK